MEPVDILIIGAGPAGMMAAIYAKRAGKNVRILDKNAPGGRVRSTYQVDNYLGFGKISAEELVEKMVNHLNDLGIVETYGYATGITKKDDVFRVFVGPDYHEAKAVILATGTNPKPLGVENEAKFLAKGISYCAVCDGMFFEGEDVAVIGGGDSALEESLYLCQLANHVTLIHDLPEFTATKGVIRRVEEQPKITTMCHTKVLSFRGEDELEAIRVLDLETKTEKQIPVKGAFIYAGNQAETGILRHLMPIDKTGYIPVSAEMHTEIPGLFACGDVTKKDYRYIVTAISDGAIAALSAVKYIDNL